MDPTDTVEEITQRLQRDVNCLGDENRTTRKRGLERLRRETVAHSPPYTQEQMQGVLAVLIKPLLKEFSDLVEKCRELAISILTEFCSSVVDISTFLPLLMPVVVARLGSQEITEPSEELRLSLVSLLTSIVNICKEKMSPYLNDMILVLQKTIVDPYPEVKKESCTCTTRLAEAIPSTFHQQSESLAKPLFQSMTHQHSKVRLACIKSLGFTIRYGSPTPLNDALPLLAQRACDNTSSVRSGLADVVGTWLLELPDRYSYFHKLIPLLLTCMTDELPEIRNKSHTLWEKVGKQYESENEEELKDKLDFMTQLEPSPHLEFGRPNLGCRVLVYRNFSKILPALLRDMSDWTVNSRMKASLLLFSLLCHLEEHTTHHIQAVLNGLYRACQDNEAEVVSQATMCSEVIGFYVPPEIWCKLVLPAIRTSAGCRVSGTDQTSTVAVGPVQCTSCLHVLVFLIKGAKPNALQPYLKAIVECVCEPEVSQSDHVPLLRELLNGVMVIVQAAGNLCKELSLNLFTVILRVRASKHSEELNNYIERALVLLSTAQDYNSPRDLYQTHARNVLTQLKEGYTMWSIHSPNCAVFSSLLSGAGPVVGELLDDIIPMLTSCLRPDGDQEMRLHFITLLIRLLMDAPSSLDSQNQFSQFVSCVVTDIVIPNCVWRGGRTAAAIRTAAMTSMQALLQSKLLTGEQLDTFMTELMPKVLSCLDDDNQSTRLVSCKVVQLLLNEKPSSINVDTLHSLYGDLLKRLDDSSDEIRVAATQALTAYINAFPNEYDTSLYKAHLEELYKGLLIHLDDPAQAIQEGVFNVLKEASKLNRSLLIQQLEEVKHKHRNTRYCELLLQFLSSP